MTGKSDGFRLTPPSCDLKVHRTEADSSDAYVRSLVACNSSGWGSWAGVVAMVNFRIYDSGFRKPCGRRVASINSAI
jgi:hypothetical protein